MTRNHIVVQGSANTFVPIPRIEVITFNNVPAGTYNLWVHGVSSGGDGPDSNGVRVVVPGTCTGIAGAPLNLTAMKTGARISLFWDLPVSGPAPTSFTVNVNGAFNGSFPLTTRSIAGDVGPGFYTIYGEVEPQLWVVGRLRTANRCRAVARARTV